MSAQPAGDGRRVVLVSVNGVAEVDPAWAVWLDDERAVSTVDDERLVDVTRGTSS